MRYIVVTRDDEVEMTEYEVKSFNEELSKENEALKLWKIDNGVIYFKAK